MGGLHICGYAHTNAGTEPNQKLVTLLGGSVENDNSGNTSLHPFEYTGYKLQRRERSNGVSFYGVGNGTTVEYLQAYKGSDDGFEFFGGSVNVKYLVATDCKAMTHLTGQKAGNGYDNFWLLIRQNDHRLRLRLFH